LPHWSVRYPTGRSRKIRLQRCEVASARYGIILNRAASVTLRILITFSKQPIRPQCQIGVVSMMPKTTTRTALDGDEDDEMEE
jgi:hypothetical protein